MTHQQIKARLTALSGTDNERARARAALAVLTTHTAAEFERCAAAELGCMTDDQVINGVCDAAERLTRPVYFYTPFHVEA